MKFNWGTGIVIAIAGFMSFIIYFVITMSTDKNYSYDLVTDKYYQQELKYQQEIDATKNASVLAENITLIAKKEGLQIKFPSDFKTKEIEGTVLLYRQTNIQLDFEMPISISNAYLLVPENRLLGGRWNITVSWTYKITPYLFKEELNL